MGNDGETTSNERSKSKGRGHLRGAPTTAKGSEVAKAGEELMKIP
jgi:hypothetical protein